MINITKTISDRQQMRAASIFYHGMFNFSMFSLPEIVTTKSKITGDTTFHSNLRTFMSDSDLICSSIFVNNQDYKNGDLIVIKATDADQLSVGVVQTILVKKDKVYFVVQKYEAVRNYMQYFESQACNDRISTFVESNKLADFKPLIKRGTSENFVFFVHHHVSFDYQ